MTYDEFCEIFFDIPGYEGYYQINMLQQVRRVDTYVNNKVGGKTFIKGRMMSPYKHNTGYIYVQLSRGGISKTAKMHRLMALTFIPNLLNKRTVNHKDGDKCNNSIGNLEWATDSEQGLHAYANGLKPRLKGVLNACYGTKRPQQAINQTRGGNPSAKVVLDTSNGVFYDCLKDARDAKQIKSMGVLYQKLQGKIYNDTSLIYV